MQIAVALSLSTDQAAQRASRAPPPADQPTAMVIDLTTGADAAPADGAGEECLLHGAACPQRPQGGWRGHERELRLHLNIACDGGGY